MNRKRNKKVKQKWSDNIQHGYWRLVWVIVNSLLRWIYRQQSECSHLHHQSRTGLSADDESWEWVAVAEPSSAVTCSNINRVLYSFSNQQHTFNNDYHSKFESQSHLFSRRVLFFWRWQHFAQNTLGASKNHVLNIFDARRWSVFCKLLAVLIVSVQI